MKVPFYQSQCYKCVASCTAEIIIRRIYYIYCLALTASCRFVFFAFIQCSFSAFLRFLECMFTWNSVQCTPKVVLWKNTKLPVYNAFVDWIDYEPPEKRFYNSWQILLSNFGRSKVEVINQGPLVPEIELNFHPKYTFVLQCQTFSHCPVHYAWKPKPKGKHMG